MGRQTRTVKRSSTRLAVVWMTCVLGLLATSAYCGHERCVVRFENAKTIEIRSSPSPWIWSGNISQMFFLRAYFDYSEPRITTSGRSPSAILRLYQGICNCEIQSHFKNKTWGAPKREKGIARIFCLDRNEQAVQG